MISTHEAQLDISRHISTTPPSAAAIEKMNTLTNTVISPKTQPDYGHFATSQNSVSDGSRNTARESILVESTPPTSISAQSSQESFQRPPDRSQAPEPETQPITLDTRQATVTTPTYPYPSRLSPNRPINQDSLLAGHKRKANGETKVLKTSGMNQHQNDGAGPLHSRTSSTLSNGSMVELSQQLRTRLSYAMVKVQNGWTSHTLDEVESLTSQHGSPRSQSSAHAHALSPHTASPAFPAPHHYYRSPRTDLATAKMPVPAHLNREWSAGSSGDSSASSSDPPPHPFPTSSNRTAASAETGTKPILAPPADIHPMAPTSRRRRPPPSHIHGAPAPIATVTITHPSTPPARPRITTAQRTLSQNAAMEADAIETLLFMSSPGNSAKYHHGNGNGGESVQTSPLRSSFPLSKEKEKGRKGAGAGGGGSQGKGKRIGGRAVSRTNGNVSAAREGPMGRTHTLGDMDGDRNREARGSRVKLIGIPRDETELEEEEEEEEEEDVERVSESRGSQEAGTGTSTINRGGGPGCQEWVREAKRMDGSVGARGGLMSSAVGDVDVV